MLPPDDARLATTDSWKEPAISPDGRQIVFVAAKWPNRSDCGFARPGCPDTTASRRNRGCERAVLVAGRAGGIAFFADGKLKRLDLDGGSPRPDFWPSHRWARRELEPERDDSLYSQSRKPGVPGTCRWRHTGGGHPVRPTKG